MDGCKRAFYSAQGELQCVDSAEDFALEENCTPACPAGMSMLSGTTMCYPNAKVTPMNTCVDKLPVKPPPSPMGPYITQQQTNLFNALYAGANNTCNTRYWKPAPKGQVAHQTCVMTEVADSPGPAAYTPAQYAPSQQYTQYGTPSAAPSGAPVSELLQ